MMAAPGTVDYGRIEPDSAPRHTTMMFSAGSIPLWCILLSWHRSMSL